MVAVASIRTWLLLSINFFGLRTRGTWFGEGSRSDDLDGSRDSVDMRNLFKSESKDIFDYSC